MTAVSPGHVFVLHSDLASLRSDVCMIPESADAYKRGVYQPSRAFLAALGPIRSSGAVEVGEAAGLVHGQRARWASVWQPETHCEDAPAYVLTSTWGDAHRAERGVGGFFDVAARILSERPIVSGHGRPLVALPIAGAEGGGLDDRIKHAAGVVLAQSRAFADRTGHDVAVVEPMRDKYAVLQELRGRHTASWSVLPPTLLRMADQIAEAARRRSLAIYAGAGLSMAAGIPGWSQLLDHIARDHGGPPLQARVAAFSDVIDKAHLLAAELGEQALRGFVAHHVARASRWEPWAVQRFALPHALLANLESDVTVTTNYDQLIEEAYEAAPRVTGRGRFTSTPSRGPGIRRLVTGHDDSAPRWLIKLHGDVSEPSSIVLTPEGYENAAFHAQALYGAVEGLFLTKRLLVVGSSMIDPPLRRVALAVRRCGGVSADARGFALVAGKNQGRVAPLWDDLFDVQSVEEDFRLSAIALDRAGAGAAAAEHFLDERFEADDDPPAVTHVRALLRRVGRAMESGELDERPALHDLKTLLGRMGWGGADV